MDDLIKLATGGISSTSAMGEGVTESTHPRLSTELTSLAQFTVSKKAKL
jgi:Isocitrate lyase family